jgi:drug/metabolite transporter (DMT)-like permease
VCTGLAFVIFFELIAEIGPTRATLITFANPAIAVVLGALVLDESITFATIGGFVLVITGCWLATRGHAPVVANLEGVSSLNDVRNASSAS